MTFFQKYYLNKSLPAEWWFSKPRNDDEQVAASKEYGSMVSVKLKYELLPWDKLIDWSTFIFFNIIWTQHGLTGPFSLVSSAWVFLFPSYCPYHSIALQDHRTIQMLINVYHCMDFLYNNISTFTSNACMYKMDGAKNLYLQVLLKLSLSFLDLNRKIK